MQRVAVARSLINDPSIVLADEPTGNLDTSTSGVVIDLLVDLNRSHGITFLLVTHEEEIARKCTRIVTIRDGLIVSDEQLVESSDSEE